MIRRIKGLIFMKILKNILTKVDGKKSIAGALGIIACIVAEYFGVNVPAEAYAVSGGLFSTGVLHKLVKLQRFLVVALEALEVLLKAVKGENAKLEKK